MRLCPSFLFVHQFFPDTADAFSSAIEPLRLATRAAGRDLYRYSLWSEDGGGCTASDGVEVKASGRFADAQNLDMLIECGFASASHFSKAYVDHFGRPPSAERKTTPAKPARVRAEAELVAKA